MTDNKTPFQAYRDIVEPLVLPYDETRSYIIPPVTAEAGANFRIAQSEGREIEGEEYFKMFLGSAYHQMLADGVDDNFVLRAAFTAMSDHQAGRAVAAIVWETGGDPKAVEELTRVPLINLQNRASRRSKNTGAVKKTKPARTSGTKSQNPS